MFLCFSLAGTLSWKLTQRIIQELVEVGLPWKLVVGFQVAWLPRKAGGQWPLMGQSLGPALLEVGHFPVLSLLVDVVLKLLPSMPMMGGGGGGALLVLQVP